MRYFLSVYYTEGFSKPIEARHIFLLSYSAIFICFNVNMQSSTVLPSQNPHCVSSSLFYINAQILVSLLLKWLASVQWYAVAEKISMIESKRIIFVTVELIKVLLIICDISYFTIWKQPFLLNVFIKAIAYPYFWSTLRSLWVTISIRTLRR